MMRAVMALLLTATGTLVTYSAGAQSPEKPSSPAVKPQSKTRFVMAGADPGRREPVELWDSEASRKECVSAQAAALSKELDRQLELARAGATRPTKSEASALPDVCTEGVLGKLTHGTSVQFLGGSEACGALVHVKVLAGKYEGKTGCVPADKLTDTRVP